MAGSVEKGLCSMVKSRLGQRWLLGIRPQGQSVPLASSPDYAGLAQVLTLRLRGVVALGSEKKRKSVLCSGSSLCVGICIYED